MNGYFKDTRLIEAFDHIDPKYIAEVGESLKLRSVYTKEGKQPKNKLHINVKQITVLAACVLLLALAAPMFTHLPEIINSFAAGGTEDETTEEVPYLQFSPELEPISQELVDEINEEFIPYFLQVTKEECRARYGENYAEELVDYRVIRTEDARSPYLGTLGDYVVFTAMVSFDGFHWAVYIGGYRFAPHTYLYDTKTKALCTLNEAYNDKIVSIYDLELLNKRWKAFENYVDENEDLYFG